MYDNTPGGNLLLLLLRTVCKLKACVKFTWQKEFLITFVLYYIIEIPVALLKVIYARIVSILLWK